MPTTGERRGSDQVYLGLEQRDADAAALLRSIATGDEEAFARLYDLYAARVFGIVKRVVRDPAHAEEVTQEVFVDLWRTAPRFDAARGSVSAWVTTMAHRRAVDRVRSEQSHRDRQTRHTPDANDEVGAEEVVVSAAERDDVGETVRAALLRLTDMQREAIELAYYGGYTYAEVAQLLDVPLGTVKTRIRDGLIRLRDALEVTA